LQRLRMSCRLPLPAITKTNFEISESFDLAHHYSKVLCKQRERCLALLVQKYLLCWYKSTNTHAESGGHRTQTRCTNGSD
jgi:hypothetical protein